MVLRIDVNKLCNDYLNEGFNSCRKLAKEYGCNAVTISDKLKSSGNKDVLAKLNKQNTRNREKLKCKICNTDKRVYFNNDHQMPLCNKHRYQISRYGKPLDMTMFDPNDIILQEKHAEVVLRNKDHDEVGRALVSLDKLDLVILHKWHLNSSGYATSNINGKTVKMHTLILGKKDGMIIDHISGDILDNRNENLRFCTHAQNAWNRKNPYNTHFGHRGVRYNKEKDKWIARIVYKGNHKRLGTFDNEEDAIKARLEAEKKYYGEYSRSVER